MIIDSMQGGILFNHSNYSKWYVDQEEMMDQQLEKAHMLLESTSISLDIKVSSINLPIIPYFGP